VWKKLFSRKPKPNATYTNTLTDQKFIKQYSWYDWFVAQGDVNYILYDNDSMEVKFVGKVYKFCIQENYKHSKADYLHMDIEINQKLEDIKFNNLHSYDNEAVCCIESHFRANYKHFMSKYEILEVEKDEKIRKEKLESEIKLCGRN
jgi:hypothetical protein